jgi:hypothetical protein
MRLWVKVRTIVFCAFAFTSSAWAQTVLFSDDFNDGNADGWEEFDGTFRVVDGQYEVTSSSFANDARAVSGDPEWTDYRFETDFLFPSGHAAMLFRVETIASGTDAGRYYQFHVFQNLAGICVMNFSGGNCRRVIDVMHTTTPNVWHRARLDIRGTSVDAYIDGNHVFKYDGLTEYGAGRIGVKRINGPGSNLYDNVLVTSLLAPALTSMRPSSGAPGKTVYARLEGANLVNGPTTVQVSGAGVTVAKVNVDEPGTPTKLTARLVISPTAMLGPRDVTVTNSGGTSNPKTFVVRSPDAACPVSLPVSASGSRGNLAVTAGIGSSRETTGNWVAGWMVFHESSVSFYGTRLFSGTLPPTNPPLIRSLSANMAPVPAVAVVNAFYSPYLCEYSITWASTSSATPRYQPVLRSQVEAVLNNLDLLDFDGTTKQIPR